MGPLTLFGWHDFLGLVLAPNGVGYAGKPINSDVLQHAARAPIAPVLTSREHHLRPKRADHIPLWWTSPSVAEAL